MSNNVFEEMPQQAKSASPGGPAVDKVRKAARQLAYDVRYKVKGKFKEGQKTSPESEASISSGTWIFFCTWSCEGTC